jgi:MFS family permease
VLVGLMNLAFTIVAILYIDKLGRRRLLGVGISGIAVCMFLLSYGFGSATYSLDQEAVDKLPAEISRTQLEPLKGMIYESDVEFREAAYAAIGQEAYKQHESAIVTQAISMSPTLILVAILGFVASFAMSLGPIMWVLFSELFPNRVRGVAISFVGFINSAVAFLVTLIFPWELSTIGNAATFLIYGLFAVVGFVLIMRILPETKGRSLEELESILIKD